MAFNQQLQKELVKWQQEGIIQPDTAEQLLLRYPVEKRSMTQTLAFLGSILVGIGVILFFAANWQNMPRLLKIAVVVLSFTSAYAVGYYLAYIKGNYPKVGNALILLGSILYGASIWLIAQIFHIEAEAGMGFFLWYLGVIPIAYLFNSSLNLALATVNLVAWFLAGNYPLSLPFLIFPVLLGGTILPLAIKKKDHFNFLVAIISTYIWFVPLGVKLAKTNFSFPLGIISLLLLSLILYFLMKLLQNKDFFAENFLLILSIVGMFISLAPFTFHDFLKEFTDIIPLYSFPYLLLSSLIIIAFLKFKEGRFGIHDLPLLLLYLCLFPFFTSLSQSMPLLIFNNILFFVFTLLLIYYGYLLKNTLVFNISMLLFAVAIAMKYFDFFFALMPRSVFFMCGGALLLLGSLFLERKRRNILKSMERGEVI